MKNQVYSEFAQYYDMLGWNKFAHVCAERLKTFVRFRGSGNETVLDLACGTGELEHRLQRTNLKFTGVDLSWQMLSQARRKTNGVFRQRKPSGRNYCCKKTVQNSQNAP